MKGLPGPLPAGDRLLWQGRPAWRALAQRIFHVKVVAAYVGLLLGSCLVVGATNSSNSNRLREIGTEVGVASYLIADGSELNPEWLKDAKAVGITAGASAPEVLVDDVIEALRRIGPVEVSVLPGREENIEFRLPAELAVG